MKKLFKIIYNLIPFKQYFFCFLKIIWKPQESIYRHLHFTGVFKVRIAPSKGFKINHHGYQIENEIFWNGLFNGWEKHSLYLWSHLCKESHIIFDIGANTGIYSLVAKAVKKNSAVYAFEPVKRVFDKLLLNENINHFDIQCLNIALSDYDGEGIIYDDLNEHILSVTLNKKIISNSQPVPVNVKKISTIIEEYNLSNIDLMKIDVETHESKVLEGMGKYLEEFRPAMIIEILNDEAAQKIQKLISKIDYLYFNIDEKTQPKLVNKLTKSDFCNYLICKKETALKLNLI